MKQRLHKILAQRGIASRREAEKIIASGRVTVNGQAITVMGALADPDEDVIRLDGRRLPERLAPRVLMLNKPEGYVSTCRIGREKGISILDLVPDDRRYFPVGRLDRESSGLLLLTDDGDLANRLLHPRHKVPKIYEVECDDPLSPAIMRQLASGVWLDDGPAKPLEIASTGKFKCRVILSEGRKRQIRRMFAAVGVHVSQLHRTQIGNLQLGKLAMGRWRELSAREIETLLSPDNPN